MKMQLDIQEVLDNEFSDVRDVCETATEAVLNGINERDYSKLAKHSPGLRNFKWDNYLKLSILRMVRVARVLKRYGKPGQKILDFGSYFGNYSLMAKSMGFDVHAFDSYEDYSPVFNFEREQLQQAGIPILDSSHDDEIFSKIKNSYDFIFFLGVIEHIPHSPRLLLEGLNDALNPGGILILDTPNLAYVYNRQALNQGKPLILSIQDQYSTEIPFQGHHREYCYEEVHWMLAQAGFHTIEGELYNYSYYGNKELSGNDLQLYFEAQRDSSKREYILAVGQKNETPPDRYIRKMPVEDVIFKSEDDFLSPGRNLPLTKGDYINPQAKWREKITMLNGPHSLYYSADAENHDNYIWKSHPLSLQEGERIVCRGRIYDGEIHLGLQEKEIWVDGASETKEGNGVFELVIVAPEKGKYAVVLSCLFNALRVSCKVVIDCIEIHPMKKDS